MIPALEARGLGAALAHLLTGAGLGLWVGLLAALLDLLAWPRRESLAPGLWNALLLVSLGAVAELGPLAEARQPQAPFIYCIFGDCAPPPPPPPVLPGDYAVPVLLGSLCGAVAFLLLRAAFGVLTRVDPAERTAAAAGTGLTGADKRAARVP